MPRYFSVSKQEDQTHVWICDGILYLQILCFYWYVQDTLAQSDHALFGVINHSLHSTRRVAYMTKKKD